MRERDYELTDSDVGGQYEGFVGLKMAHSAQAQCSTTVVYATKHTMFYSPIKNVTTQLQIFTAQYFFTIFAKEESQSMKIELQKTVIEQVNEIFMYRT